MINLMLNTVAMLGREPEKVYPAGTVIFREGEAEELMFGLVEGEVEMTMGGKHVETIQAGDVFGIGALVHQDHLRTSTAIAKTDCRILTMDREHFLFAVQQAPMFALEVIASYSDRYRALKKIYEEAIAQ